MGAKRKRLPVLSQLTVAWTVLGLAAGGVVLYALVWGANALRPEKIALPLGEVETLARAEAPTPTRSLLRPEATGERLEPNLDAFAVAEAAAEAEMAEEPSFVEGADEMSLDGSFSQDTDEDALDIVITVDGAPAEEQGRRALEPRLAALTDFKRGAPIPAADPALLQSTPLGKIPKIGPDGRRALKVYAAPFKDEAERPRVGLIVGGLGLNPVLTERAIEELPPFVTLAFAPYAKDLELWTAKARAAGHEIMIELPMEHYGSGPDALGPAALLTSRSEEENLQRLDWLLSRFGGYVGATNYMGGKFSADRAALSPVMQRLNALGLAYIDDTGAAKQAAGEARNWTSVNRMIAAKGDLADEGDIARDLAALEKTAAAKGDALGKTYAFEGTIDAVAQWARGLEAKDVALAPASAILHARAARG